MEILIRLSVYFNCLNLVPVGEQSEGGIAILVATVLIHH